MFKRVSSLVLAVMMLFTMLSSMTVFAATNPAEITVEANMEKAEIGDTVTFTYYVESEEPWASVAFNINYDSNLAPALPQTADGFEINDNNGVICVAKVSADNVAAGKVSVVAINFTIKNTAVLNNYLTTEAYMVDIADEDARHLSYYTGLNFDGVYVVCKHTGAVTPKTENTHYVNCSACGQVEEPCVFVYDRTVNNVPHGQAAYKVEKCACGNERKVTVGSALPHVYDQAVSRGSYNKEMTHNLVCKADGAVSATTEKCKFDDTTSCQITCRDCGAVYNNPNPANVVHKNTSEHYYAPTTVAGKITEVCSVCGYVDTRATGTWAFTDVAKGTWFYHAITFNKAYGLFNGTSETQFSPDDTITRGQAATVLSRMLIATINEAAGSTVITEQKLNSMSQKEINDFVDTYLDPIFGLKKADKIPNFTDVPMGQYYGGHVRLMATLGIINGKTATTFAPDDNVTRQELAKLMKEMVGKVEKINGKRYTSFGTPVAAFTDTAKVWGKDYIEWARTTGLMNGMSGTQFAPEGTATRAQVATLMMRLKIAVGEITTHNM